ncbi:MAG TPA: OB-fold domain-containing protein [Candidatus Binataceae bacterium]|jgi:hypothetical protein
MERSTRFLPAEWIVPAITPENRAFFTSGELRLQRCRACGVVQHPPGEVCHACQAMEFDYIAAPPLGVVETFTIVHHVVHPMLRQKVPYNVAVISLRDYPHVRIVGNVIDVAPERMRIGLPVACTWAEVRREGDGAEPIAIYIPQWTAAGVN